MAGAKVTEFIAKQLHEIRNELLTTIVHTAIDASPVDTGAYVESMSVTQTRGSGRSRTSHGRPRKQPREVMISKAKGMVDGDIASIPPEAPIIYINNHAPHAGFVEGKYGPIQLAREMMRGRGGRGRT